MEIKELIQNNPIYYVRIHVFGFLYEINFNGNMLLDEDYPYGQLTTNFPVNHLIKPDDNHLEIKLYPSQDDGKYNENAVMACGLILKSDAADDGYHIITSMKLGGAAANNGLYDPSSVQISSGFFKEQQSDDSRIVTASDVEVHQMEQPLGGLIYSRTINAKSPLIS